ncbi:MAG: CBS domain-containing protein [Deltaproteobacteria bacterium]|nr:CBS domain-containing protein [Deltaproteobacteria bacterium]
MTAEPELLPVRTRYTLMGDGTVATERTVRCPRRRAAVLLDGCLSCEHQAAHPGDDDRKDGVILCRGARPERPLEWPDRPAVAEARRDMSPSDAGSLRRRPELVLVHRVMSTEVICVAEDVSTDSLMALLLNRDISGAPVVDERGRLKGVVSKTDLVRDRYDQLGVEEIDDAGLANNRILDAELGLRLSHPSTTSVGELMTPVPQAISETGSVARAAALMAHQGIHRLPVVSRDQAVVGILTAHDVLRWVAQGSRYALPSRGRRSYPNEPRSELAPQWSESH